MCAFISIPWIPRWVLHLGIQDTTAQTYLRLVMQRYLCHINRMFHDTPDESHKDVVMLEAIDDELNQILVLEVREGCLPLHVFLLIETIVLPELFVSRHHIASMIQDFDRELF